MKPISCLTVLAVFLAFPFTISSHAAQLEVQYPSEPITPTSMEECKALQQRYLALFRQLNEQGQQCHRSHHYTDPWYSGNARCGYVEAFRDCVRFREASLCTYQRMTEAWQLCANKVSAYKQRSQQVNQFVAESFSNYLSKAGQYTGNIVADNNFFKLTTSKSWNNNLSVKKGMFETTYSSWKKWITFKNNAFRHQLARFTFEVALKEIIRINEQVAREFSEARKQSQSLGRIPANPVPSYAPTPAPSYDSVPEPSRPDYASTPMPDANVVRQHWLETIAECDRIVSYGDDTKTFNQKMQEVQKKCYDRLMSNPAFE